MKHLSTHNYVRIWATSLGHSSKIVCLYRGSNSNRERSVFHRGRQHTTYSASTRRSTSVVLMLFQRMQRFASSKTTSVHINLLNGCVDARIYWSIVLHKCKCQSFYTLCKVADTPFHTQGNDLVAGRDWDNLSWITWTVTPQSTSLLRQWFKQDVGKCQGVLKVTNGYLMLLTVRGNQERHRYIICVKRLWPTGQRETNKSANFVFFCLIVCRYLSTFLAKLSYLKLHSLEVGSRYRDQNFKWVEITHIWDLNIWKYWCLKTHFVPNNSALIAT